MTRHINPLSSPAQSTAPSPASAITAEATSIICLENSSSGSAQVESTSTLPHPLLAGSLTVTGGKGILRFDQERNLAAKMLFARKLQSRSTLPVSCPARLAAKGTVAE